jgi:dTDP-4-dehydrorhamnose reductase
MYCVLGSTGFIGRNLVKDLDAIAISRRDLDLTDRAAVDSFFENNRFEVVINCSVHGGIYRELDDIEVFKTNVLMFENVARHAHKFRRLVWFSSGAAICAPETPYGRAKQECESLARAVPNCQVFRIYGCYGLDEPSTRFISSCLSGQVKIHENKYFDFFWVGDIHKVVTNFTKCDGRVRDLVYETKRTLAEVARLGGILAEDTPLGISYIGEFDEEIAISIGVRDRTPQLTMRS